ncbi:MAG: PD40 domain-containing protein, partial [Acidobacteriales bacterium]|nr:PD40 domain-containing protein [Terriglobales bacterium]
MNCARLPLRLSTVVLILSFSALHSLPAQTTNTAPHQDARIGAVIQSIGQAKHISQAALSPDGKTVAWSLETRDGSQLRLTDIDNPTKETPIHTEAEATDCSYDSPTWSPDGQWLAYASTCSSSEDNPDQQQIFLWSRKTGQSRQLTHVTGEIDMPAWSPDGRSLAFLFVQNATRTAGALAAMKPWSGVIGEEGAEVQRIAVASVATGALRQVTPANLHVYEFDWSPDSRQMAYIAANPPGENNWWVAHLYIQTVQPTTATQPPPPPQSILDTTQVSGQLHNLQIAVPRWSPDGKQIAFIGGLMSDQGSTGGDIYLIPATGGEPRDITPGRPAS